MEKIIELLYKNKNLLTDREFFILKERLGVRDGFPKTQQQIARYLKISRQRVYQLEKRAIFKIAKGNLLKDIDKISKDMIV